MQINRGDYRLLVVKSQIGSLTPNHSMNTLEVFFLEHVKCAPSVSATSKSASTTSLK